MWVLLGICMEEQRQEVLAIFQAFSHVASFLCHNFRSYRGNCLASLFDVLVLLGREVGHHFNDLIWKVLRNEGHKNLGFGVVP